MKLVIVESPAKCKKIEGYLGPGFRVMASYGHVRDLPQDDLGIDFSNGRVLPRYIHSERGAQTVAKLQQEAQRAEAVILATDPDREGEAIAWHLAEAIGQRRYQRATFNAITQKAVLDAMASTRAIDMHLVNAQQARRMLDRIVGYLVSPTCARGSGMKEARSAGRVQSVALRIVVAREREIQAFTPQTFQVPEAHLEAVGKKPTFKAELVEWKGEPLAYRLSDPGLAQRTVAWCRRQPWVVQRAQRQEVAQPPPPPFITSTLQQAASVELKLAPQATMKIAQQLYESGRITYMRTDSTHLSDEAVALARDYIARTFAQEYLPERAVLHKAASASAQEAHEAIRPTAVEAGPGSVGDDEQGRLYRLIFTRFIACQMASGRDQQAVIDVAIAPGAFNHQQRGPQAMGVCRATGKIVLFDGWRRMLANAKDEVVEMVGEGDQGKTTAKRLPQVERGEVLRLIELIVKEKTTKAPARYTEASLIKALEKLGVGRPSTYANIMATIQGRSYVTEKQRKLHATELGEKLCAFLVRAYAGNFIEPGFTNTVEADLDRIAAGTLAWEPYIHQSSDRILRLAQGAGLGYNPLAGEVPYWRTPGNHTPSKPRTDLPGG
jgi:DNA topoisomerase-1